MTITHRKMLFYSLAAFVSGIVSILLRDAPYIDLPASSAEYLYILFILHSVLRLFGAAPTILRSIPPIIMVLALSPHFLRDVFHHFTGNNITHSFFLTYACFSFMVVAPFVEIITVRNEAKQRFSQDCSQNQCKHCGSSMFSTDIFCPKCNKLSADVISFFARAPNITPFRLQFRQPTRLLILSIL